MPNDYGILTMKSKREMVESAKRDPTDEEILRAAEDAKMLTRFALVYRTINGCFTIFLILAIVGMFAAIWWMLGWC